MLVRTFPAGPLGCNCSILADPETRDAIVIDPGGDFERIQAELMREELNVRAIVHTHTHIDHVGATAPLQRWSGAEAMIHEADRFLYDMLPVQASLLRIQLPEKCEMVGSLEDEFCLGVGSLELAVIHTPGHTPGSVCFHCKGGDKEVLFSGDTLFERSIGRTDLWGGDSAQILRSIKDKLLPLPEDTWVIPGHGDSTSIGEERAHNPFLRR